MKRASCGLLYGAMNTTKTTNLGRIARYLYEHFGLISRLISADNEHDTLEPLIDAGIIEPFDLIALNNPFGVLVKLSRGFWPVSVNGKLVMRATPVVDGYMRNLQGKPIGAYLIEGTTTIGELLHEDHIRKGRAIGEDVVGKFEERVDVDGGIESITFAKSARAHYQHVQDFVTLDLIPTFSMLPVRWIWWTGHEYAGEDEATGQTRLGPGVVGKAATMKVPRKMGNTFHCVGVEQVKTDARTHTSTRSTEYRAYFEPHADRQLAMLMWPAGVKLPVEHIPAWRKKFSEGYIPLTLDSGIEQYLQFHDELVGKDDKLVLTPGAVPTIPSEQISGEVVQLVSSTAPAPALDLPAPSRAAPLVSQVRPPARGFRPVARPGVQPIRSVVAPTVVPVGRVVGRLSSKEPNLEAQLTKSIEQVTGAPVDLPDINAVPASTTPEKESNT